MYSEEKESPLSPWDLPLLTVAGCYLLAAVCWLGVNPEHRLGDVSG